MIRGYVAAVDRDLPLPNVGPKTCRKTVIRFLYYNEDFFMYVLNYQVEFRDDKDYPFKVMGNIRSVDKSNIANGIVRIGFIRPNRDIGISSDPEDLKAFVHTMEVVNDLKALPPKCCDIRAHKKKSKCLCNKKKFSQYRHLHINKYMCPLSVLPSLCAVCCYSVLRCYNADDAYKIINTWRSKIDTANIQGIHSITVTSYLLLRKITALNSNLIEVPEALGSLPCLTEVNFSHNQLGQATNWNWLTSPFIRENLRQLCLSHNRLTSIPDSIMSLKNLETLTVSWNYLTELPHALGNLKYLRKLSCWSNKLVTLPKWMYRQERLPVLLTSGNDFFSAAYNDNDKPLLNPKDFVTVAIPSLFETVAKYIITERLPIWEYSIPAKVASYLQGAYYCRCSSVVFCDTVGQVVQCRIKTEALAQTFDHNVVNITMCCCSYNCYKLIEPYITL